MNKQEFLEIMRKTLNGEVEPAIIEQNISYYDEYIGNRSYEAEKAIIAELGDPRLIAKTIIERDRAAKQKRHYGEDNRYNYSDYEDNVSNGRNNQKSFIITNFKWYQKLMIAFIVILLILIAIIVSGILLKIIFSLALPIILVVGIILLFKQR